MHMIKPYAATSLSPRHLAELTRLMIEEVKEAAVFFMDVNGVIESWNSAAEVMKGYTADEAIGSHLSMLYTILRQRYQAACGNPGVWRPALPDDDCAVTDLRCGGSGYIADANRCVDRF